MRVIHLYLIIYFLLLAGAAAVLWNVGLIQRMPALWVVLGTSIVVLLGVLLAVLSENSRRTPTP